MTSYRIVLADDHVMIRNGIKKIIEESDDMEIVAETGDGLELLNLLKNINPHMIILDISMPNLRGIEAAHEVKMVYPEIKVVILTMHKKKEYLYHALSAGADGYLLKEDTGEELLTAITKIRRGGIYLSPILSEELTSELIGFYRNGRKPLDDPLTMREKEILKLIAEEKSSKEIANLLFISVRTVGHHRSSIMKKLNINKIAGLVKYAIQKGYT
ncbi:MAG: DNA-binding response regulator [Desulfobacteraceae bacterium 4572_187]|nr:MAG: DNA-binding response regulator [Desulfobacteraceae bacterium 4572_187]